MRLLLLSSTLFAVTLVGCGGPAVVVKDPGPAALPAGWTLAENKNGGVSVGIAPGWGVRPPRMMGNPLGEMVDTGNPQVNQLAGELNAMELEGEAEEAAALEKKGIYLTLYNQGVRPVVGEPMSRYFVKKKAEMGNLSLDRAAKLTRDELIGEDAGTKVTLPIGDAMRFNVREETRDGGVLSQVVYVLVNGNERWTVRFVTREDPSMFKDIHEPVLQTLRIRPAKG